MSSIPRSSASGSARFRRGRSLFLEPRSQQQPVGVVPASRPAKETGRSRRQRGLTAQQAQEMVHAWDQQITRLQRRVSEMEEQNALLVHQLKEAIRMCDAALAKPYPGRAALSSAIDRTRMATRALAPLADVRFWHHAYRRMLSHLPALPLSAIATQGLMGVRWMVTLVKGKLVSLGRR